MSTVVPDAVGVQGAWRAFIVNDDLTLSPVVMGRRRPWPPRERMEAVCESDGTGQSEPHAAPEESCSCGVWALKELEAVGLRFGVNLVGGSHFIARVALWGDVIPGDDGFRAQYAYPLKLYGLDTKREQLEQVAAKYGIPHAVYTLRHVKSDDYGTMVVADFMSDEYIESD